MTLKGIFRSTTALSILLAASPAFAQASTDEVEEPQNTILVTARGVEQDIIDVPVSIVAFDQEEIDAAGITDIEELTALTPGFKFVAGANGGVGRANEGIRFRGLGLRATDPTNRPGATFWDGAVISFGVGVLPLIDLERVEVIKGPQVAYFGRNTFAGAANFIPAEPGDEWSGKAQVNYEFADEDGYGFQGAIGGPITDTLGVRVAALVERVGADFNFANGDPLGQEDNFGMTGVLVWEPTNALKIKASGIFVDSSDTYQQASQLADVAPGDCNRTYEGQLALLSDRSQTRPYSTDLSQSGLVLFCGILPDFDESTAAIPPFGIIDDNTPLLLDGQSLASFRELPPELESTGIIPGLPESLGSNYKVHRGSLNGAYTLENGGEISTILSHGSAGVYNLSDAGRGTLPLPLLVGLYRAVSDTHLEVRYTSPQDQRLRYMVGASYYRQTSELGVGVFAPTVDKREATNIGIFASLDFDVTDQLTFSAESRWHDDELVQVFNGTTGTTSATNPNTIEDQAQSYDAFMPRLILNYEAIEDLNLYASWSQSRLQGTLSNSALVLEQTGVDLGLDIFTPVQKNNTFEIGAKQQVGWASYTVALYYTRWDNQVFSDGAFNEMGMLINANIAGETEIKGIDFELIANPAPWFDFRGGFTYNDVSFVDFAGTGSISGILSAGADPARVRDREGAEIISVAGNQPRSVPDWTGSASGTVWIDELAGMERRAWIRGDAIYTGDFFSNEMNFNVIEGNWRFNLRAGAEITELFSVEGYVENLTDNLSLPPNTGTGPATVNGAPGRRSFGSLPVSREFGVRLMARF
ncbi:MAG: TonB-dependent receptor [Pseudomonadota bacterium]